MLNHLRAALAAQRGTRGEQAAADLLRRSGWRILDRNWRSGRLELDLVADNGQELVFVEVRTRAANGMLSPLESITPAKQRTLIQAAQHYLAAHNAWDRPCRFDVISVVDDGQTLHMEHIPHAFELNPTLGGGDSARQYR